MAQKLRRNVNWWDGVSIPINGQMHPVTKKYWNDYTGTWTSKKSKRMKTVKGTVTVYDFHYYPIERIKEDFGIKAHEKVAMFLTKQFQRQFRGYKAENLDSVYWDTRRLELFLGYKWRDLIMVLKSKRYIKVEETASKYNANKNCIYVKMSQSFIKGQTKIFDRKYLTDRRYSNSILKYVQSISREATGIIANIAKTLDGTTLQIGNIDSIIERIWEQKVMSWRSSLENEYTSIRDLKSNQKKLENPEKIKGDYFDILRAYYLNVLEIQNTKDKDQRRELYHINEGFFGGRISHTYSNMPREYRKYLRIEGEPVNEVDIKASQPTFLFVLFERWYKSKYSKVAIPPFGYSNLFTLLSDSHMDVYKYMVLKLKGMKFLRDKKSRDEMKTLFYRLVFGDPQYKLNKKEKREVIDKAFGSDFYDFLKDLSVADLGVKSVGKNYKNLSHLLQKEESEFLMKVMKVLSKKKIPFLPLYDSLIVKSSDRSIVVDAFDSVINRMDLKGIIQVK